MKAKQRMLYAVLFSIIMLIEIYIALFVRDDFIRPYIGDMLVTALICCFCRVLIPQGARSILPIYVFVFAAIIEICQYVDLVKLLGLDGSLFTSVVFGRTFSVYDLLCYAVGCLAFWAFDHSIQRHCARS